MKKALITGVTGQDGSYLARLLLERDYEVHGLRRRASVFNSERIDDLIEDAEIYEKKFFLHYGDMTDSSSLMHVISKTKPDEIYNLAAQSHVAVSFETPEYTANADGLGVLRILETIRHAGLENKTKFYQASTSEMFGSTLPPQNEKSLLAPNSPYATAKLYGYWITKNYRDAYGIFASNGIMFNHESPMRGETFVTRKIVRGLTDISLGAEKILQLGNLDAIRDWGDAREYTEIMWKILQLNEPIDLVIATGKSMSVRKFSEMVAAELEIKLEWHGSGLQEYAIDQRTGNKIIEVNKDYFRPLEVDSLQGDATLAKRTLSWEPKITVEKMISDMVAHDLRRK